MLHSKPPRDSDFYTGLKVNISQKRFVNGSEKWCSALAKAVKGRFGGTLSWIRISTLHASGHAADWISRFLKRNLEQGKRKSTLNYLLIVGAIFDSVEAFEIEALKIGFQNISRQQTARLPLVNEVLSR